MKVIAITNHKGGVGKTTTAINLSYGLLLSKRNVLIIDTDPQANCTQGFVGLNQDLKKIDSDKSALQLFKQVDSINKLIMPIVELGGKKLDIVPSNLEWAPEVDMLVTQIAREKTLANQLKNINNKYDYVVIDCAPNMSTPAVAAIHAADLIIIPADNCSYAMEGVSNTIKAIKELKTLIDGSLKKAFDFRILRTKRNYAKKILEQHSTNLLDPVKSLLFKTSIGVSEDINKAKTKGVPVIVYKEKSRGAMDYKSLTKEVINYE